MSDLRGAWNVYDREGNGVITVDALKLVLGDIGEALSPEELDALCNEADPSGSGMVVFDEVSCAQIGSSHPNPSSCTFLHCSLRR